MHSLSHLPQWWACNAAVSSSHYSTSQFRQHFLTHLLLIFVGPYELYLVIPLCRWGTELWPGFSEVQQLVRGGISIVLRSSGPRWAPAWSSKWGTNTRRRNFIEALSPTIKDSIILQKASSYRSGLSDRLPELLHPQFPQLWRGGHKRIDLIELLWRSNKITHVMLSIQCLACSRSREHLCLDHALI